MRSYVIASLALHAALTVALGVASRALAPEPPPADLIQVSLAQLPLPELQRATPPPPVEEPPPEPEPEVIPPVPEEVPVESPDVDPDPAPAVPPPEPEVAAPDTELPPQPKPKPKPKPKPVDEEFLEPERVKPKPKPKPPEPEKPAETVPDEGPAPEVVSPAASVQASSSEGVEDFYLSRVQRVVGRRWNPSTAAAAGRPSVETHVSFVIGKSGQIRDVRVVSSSGLSVFDREALRAVQSSNPLPPLPPRFQDRDGVSITMQFVYTP